MTDRLAQWQAAQARRTRPGPLHFEPLLKVMMKPAKIPDYVRVCASKVVYVGDDCMGYWELWHGEEIISWLAHFSDGWKSRFYIPMGDWQSRSSPDNSFWHLAVEAETLNDGELFRKAVNELLRLEGLVLDD